MVEIKEELGRFFLSESVEQALYEITEKAQEEKKVAMGGDQSLQGSVEVVGEASAVVPSSWGDWR